MPLIMPEMLELARKFTVLAAASSKAAAAVIAKPGAVDNGKLTEMIAKAEATILEVKALQEELDKVV